MSESENVIHGPGTKLVDIKIGDSISDPEMLFCGWRFICEVPSVAVAGWVEEFFSKSKFTIRSRTPFDGPFKEWERGMGIVVATSITSFRDEQLIALFKIDKEIFHLMHTVDSREINDPDYDWGNPGDYYQKQRRRFFK
jgi:hypothetical protein